MNARGNRICFGKLVLGSVLILTASLTYWLLIENDVEKMHRISEEFDRLLLNGKPKEAHSLFNEVIEGEGSLDPMWAGFIRAQGNGYVQLEAYVRVLAGDPSREATYEEIARLIEAAPESFHKQVKTVYLTDISDVPDVRTDLLSKYNLLLGQVDVK